MTDSYIGFGFNPSRNEHHFLVTIPSSKSKEAKIFICERYIWKPDVEDGEVIGLGKDDQTKVVLLYSRWKEIAEDVRAEFNRRLLQFGIKSGKWVTRDSVPVDRNLGKELVLLCWAIEQADPFLIPTAIRNWQGLAPEERWWLYTMTNASTGHATDGQNRGWRKAVRFALTENPISDSVIRRRTSDFELPLFTE